MPYVWAAIDLHIYMYACLPSEDAADEMDWGSQKLLLKYFKIFHE